MSSRPSWATPLRLLHQGLDARNIAQSELNDGQGEEILRIGRIKRESLLKQVKRPVRIPRQRQGALMAERRGGLPRRPLGLFTLGARDLGEDLGGERAVLRFELLDGPPSRPRIPGIKRKDRLGDQSLDAVALLEREAIAVLLRAGHHLPGNQDGNLLGNHPALPLVPAHCPPQDEGEQTEEHSQERCDR